jgi:hypothetical protein
MSKRKKRIDPNQLSFIFDQKIEEYATLKDEIINTPSQSPQNQTFEEACIEMAAAVKRAIRNTNLSREQMVDAINDYFGWPDAPQAEGKHLSLHILNHYLSKPAEYPIPAFYLFAIQRITESLEPARCLAEAEEAKVISKGEVRQWALGKLDETIVEMQRLKKELRVKR